MPSTIRVGFTMLQETLIPRISHRRFWISRDSVHLVGQNATFRIAGYSFCNLIWFTGNLLVTFLEYSSVQVGSSQSQDQFSALPRDWEYRVGISIDDDSIPHPDSNRGSISASRTFLGR